MIYSDEMFDVRLLVELHVICTACINLIFSVFADYAQLTAHEQFTATFTCSLFLL